MVKFFRSQIYPVEYNDTKNKAQEYIYEPNKQQLGYLFGLCRTAVSNIYN